MSAALRVPATRTRRLNGYRYLISYSRGQWGRLEATITIPPGLLEATELVNVIAGVDTHLITYATAVIPGFTLRSPWLNRLQYLYSRYQGVAKWYPTKFFLRFDELSAAIDRLKGLHLPTVPAELALRRARLAGFSDRAELLKHLATAEYEVAVLSGQFVSVVVHCLLTGTIRHTDVDANNRTRASLVSAWVAAGGPDDIAPPVDNLMAAHYTRLLRGAETIRQVQMTDLRTDSSLFTNHGAPNGRETAPGQVMIQVGSRSFLCPVTYALELSGDHQIATGTIQLTPERFQAAAELPQLPHGICLVVEITDTADRLLVRGAAGPEIERRFARHLQGLDLGDTRPWIAAPNRSNRPPDYYVMPSVTFNC